MSTLLRIDCSSRIEGSHSRKLADVMQNAWQEKNPAGKVVLRDLALNPAPHIENKTIEGFYMEPDQINDEIKNALKTSNELLSELFAADEILFSVPMYNFTVPSVLKAWLDQIVRSGYAFSITEDGGVKGLIEGKKVFVALSYGFHYTGADMESYDFVKPYLTAILSFIGMTDLHFISVEGSAMISEDEYKKHEQEVYKQAIALIG